MNYNDPNSFFLAGQQIPPPPTGRCSCGGEAASDPSEEPCMRQRNATSFYRAGRQNGSTGNPQKRMMDSNSMQLAMAYVPWQQWSQTYPIDQALIRGTLFPELDFPFVMGRCR